MVGVLKSKMLRIEVETLLRLPTSEYVVAIADWRNHRLASEMAKSTQLLMAPP